MNSKVTWVSENDPTPPHKNNQIKPSATITLQRIVKGQGNDPELDRMGSRTRTPQEQSPTYKPPQELQCYHKCFQHKWEAKINLGLRVRALLLMMIKHAWLDQKDLGLPISFLKSLKLGQNWQDKAQDGVRGRVSQLISCLILCKTVTSLNLSYFIYKSKLDSPSAAQAVTIHQDKPCAQPWCLQHYKIKHVHP